jgi:ubiquinone/menaquinone biosynthesis C-methylase UbiE
VTDRALRTTLEWRQLARIDPLYVVATWPDRVGSWTPEEFYEVGRSDWEDFERHWRHAWPELSGTCLEIGCGAGRITQALAKSFERVIAIDVSEEMIALARVASPDNVEFQLVDATTVPLRDGSVDAVFTCHVLQHLESLEYVDRYLAEAHRVLRPGGAAMIQLGLLAEGMRWHGRARAEIRLRLNRRFRRLRPNLDFRVRQYRWDQITAVLERVGFTAIEMRVFEVRSNGQRQAFWLARRS